MGSPPTPASGIDRLKVGETVSTPSRTIHDSDVREFAHLSGDENPLHLDVEFAGTNLFHGIVAHGLLTVSVTLGLWYRAGLVECHVVVFTRIDDLRFLQPVRPGDALHARVRVLRREGSDRGERVELESVTMNQRDEPVLRFTARLLLAAPATG